MATRRLSGGDPRTLLASERSRLRLPAHGSLRIGVGYPAPYGVAHSSLAFQWVLELASRVPDVGVHRFCSDPGGSGTTLDSGSPLGDLDLLAFSCSFEPDAVEVLRLLAAAGIPLRREERSALHPLVVLGGALAVLNPLPLSPAIDVFCLGAAEVLWPELLELVHDQPCRDRVLAELADRPGFLVPKHHLDGAGQPHGQLRQVQRDDIERASPDAIPVSHRVTPHTEYRDRALLELSRGCPERCRYCWISHNEGRLACYPTASLLARIDEIAELTPRIGLVATAVGDHPGLVPVLEHCLRQRLEVAVSSLRIPALVPEVLGPLAASGARSITIAPETGSDRLRQRLGKRVTNTDILAAATNAAACGIYRLKMYFIVGLPEETDEDLTAISDLVKEVRELLTNAGRARSRPGELRVTVNPLVPKPYTPLHREAMLSAEEYRRRLGVISRGLNRVASLRLEHASHREALWQGFLSRADASSFSLLAHAAAGMPLAQLLRRHREQVEVVVSRRDRSAPVWHFITKGPRPARSAPP